MDIGQVFSPINSDSNYPNYKKKSNNNIGQNIISVEVVDGFSMLLNLKKNFLIKFSLMKIFFYIWKMMIFVSR